MRSATKYLLPFLFAFATFPAFIVLHECGHYLAGARLGLNAKLRYAETTFTGPREKLTEQTNVLITCAGPLVGAVLMVAGFVWLRRARQQRLAAAPTPGDWLATSLALNAGRWLRGFAGPPSHPQPADRIRELEGANRLLDQLLPHVNPHEIHRQRGPTPHAARQQALAENRSVLRPGLACPWWPFVGSQPTRLRIGAGGKDPRGTHVNPWILLHVPPSSAACDPLATAIIYATPRHPLPKPNPTACSIA